MMKKNILPIDAFQDQILASIKKNPVTVIVAETGAGKSTRVPQFLLEATNYEVVVTQPRRVAAKSVAKRVAQEMNCRFGGLVGFRTAVDRNDSVETRCLFATDGLQLVRELTAAKQTIGNGVVLLVDEVHEWNQNIETLVAWTKKAIEEGAEIKVVLMSATLDHGKLSAFFNNAPVIEVPGRCFPVAGSPSTGINQKTDDQMVAEITRLTTQGSNTLVFLPGKGEINAMQGALKQLNLQAVILPLHGEVEPAEQDRVFDSYKLPKIILSTNIAQTSVTIPDIDAVVDSGLERRIELVNGVETLLLANISQADCLQRAGRAGRVREGEYVLCNNSTYANFNKYPVPEILRSLLDQMVLRLAGAGLDATKLPFYHQPDSSVLAEAKETLIAIEALDAEGKITKLGHKINKFPTNVKAARMIIEAIERKCLGPVMTIAAVLGTQGGTLRRRGRDDDPADFKSWMSLIDPDKKYQSDLLVELELFWKAKEMRPNELAKNGIMPKAYGQASEVRGQLREALAGLGYQVHKYDQNSKDDVEILKSVAAGMVVHLYRHTGGGDYENGRSRKIARESIINRLDRYPNWIVGEPFNISFKNRRGYMQTMELVSSITAVEPGWMIEIAPHLVTSKVEKLYWKSEQSCVVEDHITIFNDQEIARVAKPAPWSTEAFKIFVNAMMSTYTSLEAVNELYRANSEILNQYNAYHVRSGGTIPKKDSETVRELYARVLGPNQVLGFAQFETLGINPEELTLKLSDLISQEEITAIEAGNPNEIEVGGEKFLVTYKNDYGNFYARIEVTESFILEAKTEAITLPNGRELKLYYNGYTRTLCEHREVIEKARLEEIERVQRNLVYNFENQISEALQTPSEMPFYQWGTTELGGILRTRLEALKAEMIEGLTQENSAERVEVVRSKAEEIKTELRKQHENAQALIAKTEESFEKTLAEVQQEFVRTETDEIRNHVYQAKNALQKAEFAEVENYCCEAERVIANLQSLAETHKQERDKLIKINNVPEYLLDAFRGDLDRTLQFMQNVAKVETWRLDAHELTCGRSRASATCENAWSAMGETDFFCGADPNDVKYYVYEYHFGEDATPVGRKEEKGSYNSNLSASNNPMEEALRNAGLIKN